MSLDKGESGNRTLYATEWKGQKQADKPGGPCHEPWAGCDGNGPRENEMGEASQRKDGKEFGFNDSSILKSNHDSKGLSLGHGQMGVPLIKVRGIKWDEC